MKHTPGPWVAHNSNCDDYIDIDANGERICSICLDTDGIAFEGGDDTPEREIAMRWANAMLIASAPELLATTESFLNHLACESDYSDKRQKYLRELIAKAKGELP